MSSLKPWRAILRVARQSRRWQQVPLEVFWLSPDLVQPSRRQKSVHQVKQTAVASASIPRLIPTTVECAVPSAGQGCALTDSVVLLVQASVAIPVAVRPAAATPVWIRSTTRTTVDRAAMFAHLEIPARMENVSQLDVQLLV